MPTKVKSAHSAYCIAICVLCGGEWCVEPESGNPPEIGCPYCHVLGEPGSRP